MNTEVEAAVKEYVEREKAFQDVDRRLREETPRFINADYDAPDYYKVSAAHTSLFDEWVAAFDALQYAGITLHEKAIDAAHYPENHPMRKWVADRRKARSQT